MYLGTRDIFSDSRRCEDEKSCETSGRTHPSLEAILLTVGRRVVGEVICSI